MKELETLESLAAHLRKLADGNVEAIDAERLCRAADLFSSAAQADEQADESDLLALIMRRYTANVIDRVSAGREAAIARAEQAEARAANLETGIRFALAAGMTELNLGNYDHDDVCALQNEAIEIYSILIAALDRADAAAKGGAQ